SAFLLKKYKKKVCRSATEQHTFFIRQIRTLSPDDQNDARSLPGIFAFLSPRISSLNPDTLHKYVGQVRPPPLCV
ncbi:hypothetical protein, partial [Acinetobacter baumannii]|uniref:hypothetical protein n=1 Tax=Acinetobacter baumannii TaxID=470 RepID=UPI001969C992